MRPGQGTETNVYILITIYRTNTNWMLTVLRVHGECESSEQPPRPCLPLCLEQETGRRNPVCSWWAGFTGRIARCHRNTHGSQFNMERWLFGIWSFKHAFVVRFFEKTGPRLKVISILSNWRCLLQEDKWGKYLTSRPIVWLRFLHNK